MATLDINGTRFEYFDSGSGPPIVLVHGSASDYRTWRKQHKVFARHFRTISYSRRYHWPNIPIMAGETYSMDQQLKDLKNLLIALDATPAHLVGHSYGAVLCLLLAMREPSLVQTLVLAEPPAVTLFINNRPSPLEVLHLLATRPSTAVSIFGFILNGVLPARKLFMKGDMQGGLIAFADVILGDDGYSRLSESRKEQVQNNLSNIKAELLGPGLLPLPADQVKQIRAPTLLLTGEKSTSLFRYITKRLEELIPANSRTTIPSASHIIHEDNPTQFNAIVISYIEKQLDMNNPIHTTS